MKLTALKTFRHDGGLVRRGSPVTMPEVRARRLLAKGYVEEAEAKKTRTKPQTKAKDD